MSNTIGVLVAVAILAHAAVSLHDTRSRVEHGARYTFQEANFEVMPLDRVVLRQDEQTGELAWSLLSFDFGSNSRPDFGLLTPWYVADELADVPSVGVQAASARAFDAAIARVEAKDEFERVMQERLKQEAAEAAQAEEANIPDSP